MTQIEQITGTGIPLTGNDIDTDRIIPARFLKCVTFDGLGEQVFADDRAALEGRHPFDQPQYQGATILVVNRNFGCGSSREHAPQAIARWGIRAVLGESFAEIFFGNCVAIGIPCLTATAEVVGQVQAALEADPTTVVTLDLATQTVTFAAEAGAVSMPEGVRQAFLAGTWDACGQLVANAEAIRATAATLPYVAW
ncbi:MULTISPECIES: 3-isopropylmalate dehydratase small subunit [Cyanophyceae]|uniref:3-isopropylmalate dehydratase small subunit n=1 Tax=Cyanophyceae TaxID=3028117 RepID=UPI00168705C8|nr:MULTISPECIES: 3-isopropylmalate dehydratase small subunit [unclassified Phormidium]MBD1918981.1 3-isopropylmalate dehydratase small subunit [Phormidium sp. FACHB-77]MBD2033154.1 3-isopropylmalate dehydratase small subunit [Phormidium sp. FACHB-322]MBD2054070.1 3-isopropylmalate dehydratase small subunit [Leptolyngbya sp. FACHB-60]